MLSRVLIPSLTAVLIFVALAVFNLPLLVGIILFIIGTISFILSELSKKEAPELVMREGKWYDEREDNQVR